MSKAMQMIVKGNYNMNFELKDLYDELMNNHEEEFIYNNKTYILQPEVKGKKEYLVIYSLDGEYLAKEEIKNGVIDKSLIDKILNTKCFDGKSFIEIKNNIEITSTF